MDGTGGTCNAAGKQGWGLLFVNAGLEPERPLEAQKDSFCGAAAALPPSTAPTAATAGWCAASARSIRASTLAVLRQHSTPAAALGALCLPPALPSMAVWWTKSRSLPKPGNLAAPGAFNKSRGAQGSEEHTSELQSLMRISYAV